MPRAPRPDRRTRGRGTPYIDNAAIALEHPESVSLEWVEPLLDRSTLS